MHTLKIIFAYILASKSILYSLFGRSTTAKVLTSFKTQITAVSRYGIVNVVRAVARSGKNIEGKYAINLAKAVYFSGIKKNSTYSIIEITSMCPYDCYGCYIEDRRNPFFMDQNSIESAINELQNSAIILIQGGEPLTKSSTPIIVNALQNFPYQAFIIVTNGVYIANNGLNGLETISAAMFAVSINGPKEINDQVRFQGSYDAAFTAMKKLKEAGRYFVPVVTINTSNYIQATSAEFLFELSCAGAKDVRYLLEESPREELRLSMSEIKEAEDRARSSGHLLFTTFSRYGKSDVTIINYSGEKRLDRTGYEKVFIDIGVYNNT